MHSRTRRGSQSHPEGGQYYELRPKVWSRRKLCWRPISRWRRHKSPHRDADSDGTPSPDQTHFSFRARPVSRSRSRSRSRTRRAPVPDEPIPESLQLLTWNINAMTGGYERARTILKHMQRTIFACAAGEQPDPCVVLLQEVGKDALPALLEHAWVREHFVVVPASPDHWPAGAAFGNVTLVARTLPIASAWSLEYNASPMKRHALLVDVRLSTGTPGDERTVRIANVHLESLMQGAALRPWQLRAVAEALSPHDIDAGIVAGDMNAISPQDAPLPAWAGLVDAWRGAEDGRGNTWGYQPPTREFLPGRLDKVLYLPKGEFQVDVPERVGVGVKTPSGQWASDHFGLLTTIRMLA